MRAGIAKFQLTVVKFELRAYMEMTMKRFFNLNTRLAEKQKCRDHDDADLAAGRISASELQARNGLIDCLDVRSAKIEFRKPLR